MVQSQSPKRGGEDSEDGADASEDGDASQDGADDAE